MNDEIQVPGYDELILPQDVRGLRLGSLRLSPEAFPRPDRMRFMARQRHWVNRGEGGECVFLTTTVLDFVHAFEREEVRTVLAKAILRECRRSQVVLHVFAASTARNELWRLPSASDVNGPAPSPSLEGWDKIDLISPNAG